MEIKRIIESLSPLERTIIPHLKEKDPIEIAKKANLDNTSVIRAVGYLENKGVIKILKESRKIVEIGLNGALYRKKGLPERRLLNVVEEKRVVLLNDAKKLASLSEDEFKASLGVLKKKEMIELKNGKIMMNAKKEEMYKKSPEEKLIESLPLEYNSLSEEQLNALKSLENRKDIVRIKEEKIMLIEITSLGEKLMDSKWEESSLIEQVTTEMLKKESSWKKKKFRRYDVASPVSPVHGGKRHFVNQTIDYAKRIWTEMGFQEMTGNLVQSSFWNFDALFTSQDHSVREMQDTFFLGLEEEISEKELMKKVKKAHEEGVKGSKGWRYKWDENEAKKLVLRTHTTCLSARKLSELNVKELPQKFFAIGKNFRNETVDWSHGFEFNQTEGIVVDKNANFRHLLGYLKEFFKKMGYEKIRFSPAYFPYTEPSVEIHVWHPEKKIWLELGGAGIFRPEVTVPLLGEHIPVLAWGPGFDRILMNYYQIKDLRELYKNDLTQLRKIKFWMK